MNASPFIVAGTTESLRALKTAQQQQQQRAKHLVSTHRRISLGGGGSAIGQSNRCWCWSTRVA